MSFGGMQWADARELVILQTNDTHSQIDPTDKGYGGVQRRKVFVDSVRATRPDVLLVDAGDAVQGTLFFTLYGGEVEMKAMNNLGYDIAILGNHDFDNGMETMARNVAMSDADWPPIMSLPIRRSGAFSSRSRFMSMATARWDSLP